MSQLIHVVAGVIRNAAAEILLTLRAQYAHQGGLWEFPGGKVEAGETAFAALQRELFEELDLRLTAAKPLIRIRHDYGDKQILLDVWAVESWHGQPYGKEGQMMRWCAVDHLKKLSFPAANQPIITAVQLPDCYAITPAAQGVHDESFFNSLRATLDRGIMLLQLRAKQLPETELAAVAEKVQHIGAGYAVKILLNSRPELAEQTGMHGVHLDSQRLLATQKRPLAENKLVAASCHTLTDIRHAEHLHVDFIVVSPVKPTQSHISTPPLGWSTFFHLTEQSRCPAYALGGMQVRHVDWALAHGGQGIAAIRGLWVTV